MTAWWRPSAYSTLFRWAVTVAGLGVLLWGLGHYSAQYVLPFVRWVRGLGAWGPIAFVVTYTIAVVVAIPASALTLAAGALFGFVAGTVYSFIGAMLGALAAFWMGRYVVRPLVTNRLRGTERFEQIDAAATRRGITLVALLRLSLVLPYTPVNYALGITRIHTRDYTVGTVAVLPGTLVYTYYGTVIADLTGLTPGVHRGIAFDTLLGVGLVSSVAVIVIITRFASRQLRNM